MPTSAMFDDSAECCACAAPQTSDSANRTIRMGALSSGAESYRKNQPGGTPFALKSALVLPGPSTPRRRLQMKLKLLVAALAAAFSAAAFAQGSTNAPSTTAPTGNPPAAAPAGSQADPGSAATNKDKDRTHARKEHHARAKDRKHESSTGASAATKRDKDTDHSASAPASSPSSGGPASNTGSASGASGSTTPKEPK